MKEHFEMNNCEGSLHLLKLLPVDIEVILT